MSRDYRFPHPLPLDGLSNKILRSLHVDGRASWSQVAKDVDSSTSTARRRYQSLERKGYLRVIGRTEVSMLGSSLTAEVQLDGADVNKEHFIQYLQQRPDVRYLGSVIGSAKAIAELVVQSPSELQTALQEITLTFDVKAEPFLVSDTHTIGLDWVPETTPKPMKKTAQKDKVDLSSSEAIIIGMLLRNGRTSLGDLGHAIGKSESTARRVLESLKERDILSFRVLVEPVRLGFEAEFWIWLDVAPAHRTSVSQILGSHPATKFLASTTGRYGFVGQVVLRSSREVHSYITDVLGEIRGVRGVEMMMIVETHKRMWHTVINATYYEALGPDWLFTSENRQPLDE